VALSGAAEAAPFQSKTKQSNVKITFSASFEAVPFPNHL
jgi:hypothetical protein